MGCQEVLQYFPFHLIIFFGGGGDIFDLVKHRRQACIANPFGVLWTEAPPTGVPVVVTGPGLCTLVGSAVSGWDWANLPNFCFLAQGIIITPDASQEQARSIDAKWEPPLMKSGEDGQQWNLHRVSILEGGVFLTRPVQACCGKTLGIIYGLGGLV